jgi:adenylate cyclase class 2
VAQEVEAKFKVADFRAVRRALRAAGATYCGRQTQQDLFFDTPGGNLHRHDRALRIRSVRAIKGQPGATKQTETAALLTYKGPRSGQSRIKIRQELQSSVPDARALAELLQAAGLGIFVKLQKRRAEYTLGRCRIELDELPLLGCFVEIEGPGPRAVEQMRRKLGLADEPIAAPYLELVASRCKELGRSCREITFRSCRRCRK